MCWFYTGIAQIALLCRTGKCGKKVPKTILASLYTPPPPYGQCPYGNNRFQKGASLTVSNPIRFCNHSCFLILLVSWIADPSVVLQIKVGTETMTKVVGEETSEGRSVVGIHGSLRICDTSNDKQRPLSAGNPSSCSGCHGKVNSPKHQI